VRFDLKLPKQSHSLWLSPRDAPSFATLESDRRVDVAIVGGGITGITAAYLLKEAGLTVALIEAERLASGVSGHTTAHVTEIFDCGYEKLIADFGHDAAHLAALSSHGALLRIADFIREEDIECDFERLPAFQYTEDEEKLASLEAEGAAALSLGLDVSFATEVPLPFTTAGALRFGHQAQFHPRRYLLSLALAIPGEGSHIFEKSRVTAVEDGDPCLVVTAGGTVTARHVIVATHAPFGASPLQMKIASYRSYVLALRMTESGTPLPGLFWDTDDPYHYIRSHSTGDETFLVVGGSDHKTGQEPNTLGRFEELQQFVSKRFKVKSVASRWSAQVIEPVDGLPLIGLDPESRNVFVATGYSGTGLVLGTLAGMINSDLILGCANPYRDLYDPNRTSPAPSVGALLKENADFPVRFVVSKLKGGEQIPLGEIQKGEGRIVDLAGEKTGVYRDPQGLLHAVSPVCTHLGCLVGFNNAEKTWDCPCHGSRFTPDGDVLNGPAVRPLESRRDQAVVRDTDPVPPPARL
jgi:glycine/D-amino acid oxidase-like deaminating enzyme/nitrite reductase/ring-hydroxylating ferredoxin subunit